MDNESIRPNGVKSPPNTFSLRTHYQQQELALNHMKGKNRLSLKPNQIKRVKSRLDGMENGGQMMDQLTQVSRDNT